MPDPSSSRTLSHEQAIQVARAVAEQEGWTWIEPARAWKTRRWGFGRPVWQVVSNAEAKGLNVRVRVDGRTGAVLEKAYAPR